MAVTLGFPGDLVEPEDEQQLDYTVTKVGGSPFYPGAAPPALDVGSSGNGACVVGGSAAAATAVAAPPPCRVCGRPLSLVLQAYAPLPNGADCRCLLVFGCVLKGCGRKPGSWRAWRCELPRQKQQQQPAHEDALAASTSPAPAPAATAIATAPAAAATASIPSFDDSSLGDAWGIESGGGAFSFGDDADAGCGAGGGGAAAGFDFSDLAAAVEQATAKLSAPKPKATAAAAAAASAEASPARGAPPAGSCRGAAGPRLPEFYVEAGVPERELEHARALLDEYRAAAAAAADGGGGNEEAAAAAAARAPGEHGRGGASASGGKGASAADGGGEEEAWAGEGYEPATMRGVERAYVKFAKRLARAPGQVARYCPNGAPLWPAAGAPAPPPCASCGVPRAFELQLMPGLIAALGEAADMEAAAGRGHGSSSTSGGSSISAAMAAAALDAALQWDWATVAVFTCSAGCTGAGGSGSDGGGPVAREEAVIVVNESDVHTLRVAASAEAAAAEAGIVL